MIMSNFHSLEVMSLVAAARHNIKWVEILIKYLRGKGDNTTVIILHTVSVCDSVARVNLKNPDTSSTICQPSKHKTFV